VRRVCVGTSLIDVTVVLAIVGVLTSMALPSYQAQVAKGRRSDAITALTKLQVAQEQFRAQHGSYALRLAALQGSGGGQSPAGQYDINLVAAHASGFIARASLREGGLHEGGCAELTVTVADGVTAFGPSARCWNR
jgi:type IV pilus assembly protein PilE